MNKAHSHLFPIEKINKLDNRLRRFLQSPQRILKSYIQPGMRILDFGCGPGYFTIDIAKMLQNHGIVIAADLQLEMLTRIQNKIHGKPFANQIKIHPCKKNQLSLNDQVDFILAFYVMHELPNFNQTLQDFLSILKPNGKILLVEPKRHVSKSEFDLMQNQAYQIGFHYIKSPKILFSHTALLEK